MTDDLKHLKVAIVHDWFVGGGAEKVVEQLHLMFPEAPIYTSCATTEWQERLDGKIVTSYMQFWPLFKLRKFLPFFRQRWFGHLNLSDYDLVISSSGNGEAKGVKTPPSVPHICYCHSPTHFYWRHYQNYLESPGFGIFNPLARLGLRLFVGLFRRWDRRAAQRPDFFVANSNHIKDDIKKYYARDAVVIHPPVDIDRFQGTTAHDRAGFVTVGRLVPYKHTSLIVEACNQLQLPLTVVGRGPELKNLQHLAGPTVTIDANAPDSQVAKYMANAQAFVFASFEDFGITPVEALAAGTPVIAYQAGGALDYVEPKTGLFFGKQTVESLVKALQAFPKKSFDHHQIRQSAEQFSNEHFRQEMTDFIKHVLGNGHRGTS